MKIIIRPRFNVASAFSKGMDGVVINGKVGFIDKTGKFLISPQFEWKGFGGFSNDRQRLD